MSNGTASITTSSLAVGTRAITAVYGGDADFLGMTSSAFTQTVAQSGTSTAVTSDQNPAVAGQTVTFTATVAPTGNGVGTPGGSVSFYADNVLLEGAVALSGGSATFTTSALSTADHAITAVYSGDANFLASTSAPLAQTENQDASATSLALTGDNGSGGSVYGQALTLTATVTATAPGSGTPTGTVTFSTGTGPDAVTIGQATLIGGVATLGNVILDSGDYSISASYSGDADFAPGASNPVSESVSAADTSVSLSGATSGVFGQSFGVTASVSAISPGTGTPVGSVSFYEGQTLLGTVALAGGAATLSQAYAVGTHDISATFTAAGTDYNGSQSSGSQSVVVSEASSAVTLAPANPTVFGQPAQISATVAAVSPGTGAPTGAVQFFDGQDLIGESNLIAGQATLDIASLTVGSHSITAQYISDGNFSASTSASGVTQIVTLASSQSVVTATAASSFVGQSVTFTATLSAVSPGAGIPTSSVAFYDGQTLLGSGTLDVNGLATLTTSSLPAGVHSITAQYGGDAGFSGITSAAYTETVNKWVTTTTLADSGATSVWGQPVTFTATVAGSGVGAVTGTVTFASGNTTLGSIAVDGNDQAALTLGTLPVGADPVVATYNGNSNYASSDSTASTETVGPASSTLALAASSATIIPGAPVTLTATLTAVAPGSARAPEMSASMTVKLCSGPRR